MTKRQTERFLTPYQRNCRAGIVSDELKLSLGAPATLKKLVARFFVPVNDRNTDFVMIPEDAGSSINGGCHCRQRARALNLKFSN